MAPIEASPKSPAASRYPPERAGVVVGAGSPWAASWKTIRTWWSSERSSAAKARATSSSTRATAP